MKTAPLILALLWSACSLQAQTRRNYTVDLENRNPAVGSLLIVLTAPNPFGTPEGIAGFCSGALIGDRVFLTAGHCVGPSLPELPPFAKAYVSFSPTALDGFTKAPLSIPPHWIPVSTQAGNPSLPPCPPPVGYDPTSTGEFEAGDPAVTDLGLVFLSRPAGVKPAVLAPVGSLQDPQSSFIPMTTIGYGHEFPNPDLSVRDGLRKFRNSKLATVLNGVWASWELPSSVCAGDSGAPTFLNNLPEVLENRRPIVAIASDGGIDCLSKDIRVRVDTYAVQQWIKDTVKQQLGRDAVLQLGIQ